MKEHNFEDKLAFSRGVAENTHPDTISKILGESCIKVEEPSVELNKKGIDFVATLRKGAMLNIDIKSRECGCSKYWRTWPLFGFPLPEPELSLETWSVMPENGKTGKTGWTLDESKLTDYTLHVFDHADTKEVFFLPFQLLRMAFRKNLCHWESTIGYRRPQNSGTWKSQCLFVPAWKVIAAVEAEMRVSTVGNGL